MVHFLTDRENQSVLITYVIHILTYQNTPPFTNVFYAAFYEPFNELFLF